MVFRVQFRHTGYAWLYTESMLTRINEDMNSKADKVTEHVQGPLTFSVAVTNKVLPLQINVLYYLCSMVTLI